MARNPEATFRAAVERHLPEAVYRQSMGSMYANGTPDRYYEGPAGVLWAEYKYVAKLPGVLDMSKKLSALQAYWLDRAERNGVSVCVIIGWGPKHGALLTHGRWHETYTKEELEFDPMSRKELALDISEFTLGTTRKCFGRS